MYKIIKVDKRYRGAELFKYIVEPKYITNVTNSYRTYRNTFYEIRNWCWEIWGPSKELDLYLEDNVTSTHGNDLVLNQNQHWSWERTMKYKLRLYLKDDKELVLFKLRWS